MQESNEPLLRSSKNEYQPHHVNDPEYSYTNQRKTSPTVKALYISLGCLFLFFFVFVVIIAILTPVMWLKFTTLIAQNALNGAELTITAGQMQNPNAQYVTMVSNITMSQTGVVGGKLSAANVTLFYLDDAFGTLHIPEAEFLGDNQVTSLSQTAILYVSNADVFRAQAASVLNGGTIKWRFYGPITISFKQLGLMFNVDLHISKEVTIVGAPPQNVISYNLQPTSGTKDTLTATSSQSLTNPGIISAIGLGDAMMDSYNLDGVKIGTVFLPNFQILPGLNQQDDVIVQTILTDENRLAVQDFMSKYTMGVDQDIMLKGPTSLSSGAEYMLHTAELKVSVKGNPLNQLVLNATISQTLQPQQTVFNPLDVALTQTNFNFKVSAAQIGNGYAAFDTDLSSASPISCPASDVGPVLSLDSSNSVVSLASKQVMTITMAETSTSPSKNCQSYLPLAICCSLWTGENPQQFPTFNVSASGTFDVTIGEFSFTQFYSQSVIPFVCPDGDVYAGFCQGDSGYALVDNVCTVPVAGFYCNQPYYNATSA